MNWLEAADIAEDFWSESNLVFDEMCIESCVDNTQDLDYYEDFASDESTSIYSSIKSSPAETIVISPPITLIKLPNIDLNHKERKTRNIWTPEEDDILSNLAQKYKNNWNKVAKYIPSKSIFSIQKRWRNKHDPNIKKSRWTIEEDSIILNLYEKFGGNWKNIAKSLPGRQPDSVKNRFYGSIKKKLSPEDQLKYSNKSNKIKISHSSIGLDSTQDVKQTQGISEDTTVSSFLALSDFFPTDETLALSAKVSDCSLSSSKPAKKTRKL